MDTSTAVSEGIAPLLNPFLLTYTMVMSLMLLSLLRYANNRPAAAFQAAPILLKRLGLPISSFSSSLFSASSVSTVPRSLPSFANETLTPAGTRMPACVHRILTRAEAKERVLVVGDVHGCLEELQALLVKANYTAARDSVVLVGDLVNKGPLSAETVKWCRTQGFYSVRGNHDDSALAAYFRVGKFAGVSSLPQAYDFVAALDEADVAWLDSLPYTLSIEHLGVVVVHAGLLPGRPLQMQQAADMSRMRSVKRAGEGGEGTWVGVEYIPENGEAEPWAKVWSQEGKECEGGEGSTDARHLLFGHDAKRGLQVFRKATGLDTGCCYGRELTLAILPGEERISVKALKAYQVPHGLKSE
ncbi:bis(5 -nucleosyl)- symmetrical [Nannochloropsis gaditana]|uniref:Bis(5-nucleosyl)-symmetrical n=1 Tax=Nannochloropsis gaditana TaxID=72520 RepID=W7TKU5_9STRA|nr:bis(5 -nucleosyl)- symmetrical [Nannochloropsis gaditana]